MTPNNATEEMEHRQFMQRMLNYMMKKEGSSFEPFDYFKKNIRKILFLDETPENDDGTLQLGSQRTPKQANLRNKNKPISKEFNKRMSLWTKKNDTSSDKLSEEEKNRLMKEGRRFKCKKRGHRVRDCPPDEDQPLRNET